MAQLELTMVNHRVVLKSRRRFFMCIQLIYIVVSIDMGSELTRKHIFLHNPQKSDSLSTDSAAAVSDKFKEWAMHGINTSLSLIPEFNTRASPESSHIACIIKCLHSVIFKSDSHVANKVYFLSLHKDYVQCGK